jgi:hypothetical protein
MGYKGAKGRVENRECVEIDNAKKGGKKMDNIGMGETVKV